MMILDVVGKPDEPLTIVSDTGNEAGSTVEYVTKVGKKFWRVVDSLNNEIWYTERKQAGI
jgi:hypothetical protein